jgi:acyl-coenzyme A synthetase/AMP-(fatty) acid ligase
LSGCIYNATVELIDRNIDKGHSDKTAIYYRDQKISYGQLLREINKVGNGLKSLGFTVPVPPVLPKGWFTCIMT